MNRLPILSSFLFMLAVAMSSARADDAKTKILLIGKKPDHPFGTHMYLHTCEMLAKCLEQTEGVETVVSDGWPREAKTLEGVKTIVVYANPAAEMLLDGPHRKQVHEMMTAGVGLVTIHWASSVGKANLERLGPRWLSYLGGTWVSNVGLSTGKSPLVRMAPKHPICRGWKEYELHDEFYLNPTLTEEATPIAKVRAKDKDVVVGWAFERPGGGRAFGTTLGHFYRNFQQPAFRRMIVNAILWTAHVDIPTDGASVDIDKKYLDLPPRPAK